MDSATAYGVDTPMIHSGLLLHQQPQTAMDHAPPPPAHSVCVDSPMIHSGLLCTSNHKPQWNGSWPWRAALEG